MIDEAYIDFGGKSVLPLLEKYDNLLVIRTFSKSRSMAGMRIGYCMGCKEAIAAMNSIKASINSYTLSQIAISAGVLSVKDDAYFKEQCGRIVKTRDEALKTLAGLGFTGPESAANFVFVKHESLPGDYIFEELKKCGLFVGNYDAKNGDEHFMYGVCAVMECLAYMICEKDGDNVSKEFIENMLTSEEKSGII